MSKDSQPPQPTHPLQQFEVLIGEWTMVGRHPQLPDAVHGHSKFEWLKEGALLVWHFDWEKGKGLPSAYSIIGHDDAVESCTMLYTDERGVARIYQMSLEGNVWRQWRESTDFSQRMTGTFSDKGSTILSTGELSRDGSTWKQDLSVTYSKKS